MSKRLLRRSSGIGTLLDGAQPGSQRICRFSSGFLYPCPVQTQSLPWMPIPQWQHKVARHAGGAQNEQQHSPMVMVGFRVRFSMDENSRIFITAGLGDLLARC